MKRFFVLVLALVLASVARADIPHTQSKQLNALSQWEGVLRRTRTPRVMLEVAQLLTLVSSKVENQATSGQDFRFVAALRQMEKAAYARSRALQIASVGRRSLVPRTLMQSSEINISMAYRLVRGSASSRSRMSNQSNQMLKSFRRELGR